jgi:hypothetical protein
MVDRRGFERVAIASFLVVIVSGILVGLGVALHEELGVGATVAAAIVAGVPFAWVMAWRTRA